VIGNPPLAAATWKKLGKEAPVEALPIFEIVEEKVKGTWTVAVEGTETEAVRSGRGATQMCKFKSQVLLPAQFEVTVF
jgi:hypothetical protein